MDGLTLRLLQAAFTVSDSVRPGDDSRMHLLRTAAEAYEAEHGRPVYVEAEPITDAEMHELLALLRHNAEAHVDDRTLKVVQTVLRLNHDLSIARSRIRELEREARQ